MEIDIDSVSIKLLVNMYKGIKGVVMKKSLLLSIFLVSITLASTAWSFSFGGYTGKLEIKFSDWSVGNLYSGNSTTPEYGNTDGTADTFTLFKVATIKTPAATTLWFDTKEGQELVGVLYGLDDDNWSTDPATGELTINSIGGHMDIYLQDAGILNPTLGPAGITGGYGSGVYTTMGDHASSTLWLSADLVTGILSNNGNGADDHITFHNELSGITNPFTGDGSFYMSVTGGSQYDIFNHNGFGGGVADNGSIIPISDLWAQFDSESPGDFGWLTNSEDPVEGYANPIPEPATMTLFGMGLLGLAIAGRKKRWSK